ncbi:hypothetical protein N0V85_003968 [Neurospora sp. IMI 360204]|nr:hypothetical protein N0V85_003968 [Neurospora sp. IMI 360204]
MSAPIEQSIYLKNTNIIVNITLLGVQIVPFDPVVGQDLDHQPPAMPAMPVMPAIPAVPALPLPDPDLQDEVVRRPQPKNIPRASKAARSQAWKAILRNFENSHMRRMALRRSFGYSSRFQKPHKPRRDRGQSPMSASAMETAQNPIDLTMEEEE